MGIINDNFCLKIPTAIKLYCDFAKDMPIIDYLSGSLSIVGVKIE